MTSRLLDCGAGNTTMSIPRLFLLTRLITGLTAGGHGLLTRKNNIHGKNQTSKSLIKTDCGLLHCAVLASILINISKLVRTCACTHGKNSG